MIMLVPNHFMLREKDFQKQLQEWEKEDTKDNKLKNTFKVEVIKLQKL